MWPKGRAAKSPIFFGFGQWIAVSSFPFTVYLVHMYLYSYFVFFGVHICICRCSWILHPYVTCSLFFYTSDHSQPKIQVKCLTLKSDSKYGAVNTHFSLRFHIHTYFPISDILLQVGLESLTWDSRVFSGVKVGITYL